MITTAADFLPLYGRAFVLGAFGGAGLVLTHMFSRRGPMIFPVYAAILFVTALMLSQFSNLSYATRFSAAALTLFVSTAIAMTRVAMDSARQRRELDIVMSRRRGPWWAMPVIAGLVVVASAGTAALVR